VFILEHHFASKSYVAARAGFSSAYPDEEVHNKTTVQPTNRKQRFGKQEVLICDKLLSSNKAAEIKAVPVSSIASVATLGYGCRNRVLPLVYSFRA
jgi:hypothetical protein